MVGGYHIGLWCLLIAATVCDLIWGKIFNWVNGLFLLGGLFTHFILGGFSGVATPLTAIAVAFVFFFPLYLAKAFAAGDVKLLMAVGAWSEPRLVFELGMVAIVVGAIVGLVVLLKEKGFRLSAASLKAHLKITDPQGRIKGTRIPFAPAFLCAFFLLKIWEKYQ